MQELKKASSYKYFPYEIVTYIIIWDQDNIQFVIPDRVKAVYEIIHALELGKTDKCTIIAPYNANNQEHIWCIDDIDKAIESLKNYWLIDDIEKAVERLKKKEEN